MAKVKVKSVEASAAPSGSLYENLDYELAEG